MNESIPELNIIVRLRFNEWQSLIDMCNDKNSLLKYVISVSHHYDSALICVRKKDVDCIIDVFVDLLAKIGFNEEYNPNKEGKIIESVIDKFTNIFRENYEN